MSSKQNTQFLRQTLLGVVCGKHFKVWVISGAGWKPTWKPTRDRKKLWMFFFKGPLRSISSETRSTPNDFEGYRQLNRTTLKLNMISFQAEIIFGSVKLNATIQSTRGIQTYHIKI